MKLRQLFFQARGGLVRILNLRPTYRRKVVKTFL